jgi:hypothetical protein
MISFAGYGTCLVPRSPFLVRYEDERLVVEHGVLRAAFLGSDRDKGVSWAKVACSDLGDLLAESPADETHVPFWSLRTEL